LGEVLARAQQAQFVLISPDRFRGGPGQRTSQLLLSIQQFALLVRAQPTVVHVHEHPALLAAAVVYAAIVHRSMRVVYTIHVDPVDLRVRWKRLVLGWLMSRCSAVTAVSAHTAAQLRNIAEPIPRHVRVVPGGTDIVVRNRSDPAVAAFRARYGVHGNPILCQVTPLNFPRKVAGVLRLVQAFSLVRRTFPDAQLLVVGDGDLRGAVEACVRRYGLGDRVVLTGYVDDVSLPLAASDVYCHVTDQDACPLSLLEAMRSGKPVVASRTGGIPEIIADGVDGVLVENGPTEVAQAISRMLEAPAMMQTLGRHAAATAAARFTWEHTARTFSELYELHPPCPMPNPQNGRVSS
jgi:glycosyltransferase involved in cell wall biosynthesis